MTISAEMMMAVLSLDSYNRGYDSRIEVSGDKIGTITITAHGDHGVTAEDYQGWKDAGFYAVAYDVEDNSVSGLSAGQQIISYRGTTDYLSAPWGDAVDLH